MAFQLRGKTIVMQHLLDRVLKQFVQAGSLGVRWPDGAVQQDVGPQAGPQAGVWLKNAAAVRALLFNPGLAFGESYMEGAVAPLDCSLYDLLHLLMLNAMRPGGPVVEQLGAAPRYVRRGWLQFNPAARSRPIGRAACGGRV